MSVFLLTMLNLHYINSVKNVFLRLGVVLPKVRDFIIVSSVEVLENIMFPSRAWFVRGEIRC